MKKVLTFGLMLAGFGLFGGASTAVADDVATTAQAPAWDSGNIAWMLVSSALVLMMTAPGLAMFYGGLVRKKNILGVMMQCIFLMGLMSVVWAGWGYSLSFGGTNPYVGNFDHVLLKGVLPYWDQPKYDEAYKAGLLVELTAEEAKDLTAEGVVKKKESNAKALGAKAAQIVPALSATAGIPTALFMMFQGMFFIITPALICGAFAERMKFSTMCVFSVLWGTFVYCPVAHWVWSGAGWLCEWNSNAAYPALDFAGGTVVHISSGVSALVCALLVGKRLGFGHEPMPPHNLTYTFIGTGLLWMGWFGFNGGSALSSGPGAVNALVATHMAAAAGVIAWSLCEWVQRGKPSILGACSGAVAGLVVITPASGSVTPISGIVMGFLAGLVCFWSCTKLKNMFKYDDSLDAFGVHGVGGILGALLTGVFATQALVNPDHRGLLEGNGHQMIPQLVSVLATIAIAVVGSVVLLKVLDATMGLRVSQDDEIQGLDVSQHGEEGYIFL
ncbi:MAG: ammonium transporter [Planctomycetaceae bacterium]